VYGHKRETCCWRCGTEYVQDDEAYDGPYSGGEITHEMPAPEGSTLWAWEQDRAFRMVRRDETGERGNEDGSA
jgi:hypothetical protein